VPGRLAVGAGSRGGLKQIERQLQAAALTLACSPPSAEDLVQERIRTRQDFQVELNSWVDRTDGQGQPYLYLDLQVLKERDNPLDELTVKVEQIGEQEEVLSEDRVTLDVADLTRGLTKSMNAEVRPMAEGVVGLRVFIEPDPPRENWDEFPEFDEVRPRT